MQSLRELLGSGMALSSPDIPRYDDREKLLLSYILASSLLYLYPGDWIPMDWSSDRIFFPRHSGSRRSPIFTLPYLSVNLQQGGAPPKVPPVSQYHKHPAILALGIMLLEIATGVRFDPAHGDGTAELDQADRYNEYGSQALRILDDLERQGERHLSRRIPPVLSKVVRSCLILNPSPSMAAEQMSEEGPIRHYILSCIATPLAVALSEGYHVSLDELQDALDMRPMPESPLGVTERSSFQNLTNTAKSGIANPLAVYSPTKPSATGLTHRAQTSDSLSWITKFQRANTHLESLSEGSRSEAIKVAILDTGCNTDDPYFSGAGIDRVDDWGGLWYDCLGLGEAQQDIAKAVLHAVTMWDVDVISMSFGFSDEVKLIKDAIVEAERLKGDKILFFAAASNDGLNEPEMFPAFFESVISARGTKHDGEFIQQYNPKSWGHKSGIQYGTLARDVPYGWPASMPTKSGCSVATPILAAIAAMLISFVDSQESWDAERHAIRTRRGMTAVFNLMARDQNSFDRLYVAPWQLYENRRQPRYLSWQCS
ncbi:uncharacterized protein NECHADRAFT_99144 [Fusarium vanettenii 77-13-4]|uniref:Uncharacterized protein n=1 Tax=Fusarium vanettenii (strain ATCC MYA-4622 / CBS 123669 / FGSC 9596 / NRRL 45880 / 77-13-4) TaxID=660122 RepID=C7Z6T7_FUSV7|nr:uncharacterized protein NECHADRAFT_99144 [Fusarium vanettenii 77-13-4]EEU40755.1 hypothetical protein NECHADRAFT_99144 [Fusarium vanettenii 77-13-4]